MERVCMERVCVERVCVERVRMYKSFVTYVQNTTTHIPSPSPSHPTSSPSQPQANVDRLQEEYDNTVIPDEITIAQFALLHQQLREQQIALRGCFTAPVYALPFIQPGRLVRVATSEDGTLGMCGWVGRCGCGCGWVGIVHKGWYTGYVCGIQRVCMTTSLHPNTPQHTPTHPNTPQQPNTTHLTITTQVMLVSYNQQQP